MARARTSASAVGAAAPRTNTTQAIGRARRASRHLFHPCAHAPCPPGIRPHGAGVRLRDYHEPYGDVLRETNYTYNVQGRLKSAEVDSDGDGQNAPSTSQYTYNADGIRVRLDEAGVVTNFLVDSNNPTGYAQVLEERNASNTLTRSYTLGHDVISQWDKPAAPNAPNEPAYLLTDGHGSTRLLVAASGTVAERYLYDAYGNMLSGTGYGELKSLADASTRLLYSGEQTDKGTNLQYLRARFYDPATGRFHGLDPFAGIIQDPQSLHKYAYAHSDPIRFSDPTGLFPEGGLIGLLGSFSISSQQRGSHGAASAQAGQTAQTFAKALQIWDRIRNVYDRITDVLDWLEFSNQDLQEMASSLTGIRSLVHAGGRAVEGTLVSATFRLPRIVSEKLGFLHRFFGNSNIIQEAIGEIGTALVAYAVGFEQQNLVMDRLNGIDQITYHSGLGMWGIFEAKGGKGPLGSSLQGQQMMGTWIGHWLRDTIRKNPTSPLGTAFDSGSPMLAGVVRVNYAGKRFNVRVGAQVFVPPNGARMAQWKGFR